MKVDRKERIVIPSDNRRKLNIKNLVKLIVKGGEITLRPVEDTLKSIEELVAKGTRDVEGEIQRLRRVAERELQKEV